VIGVDTNVLLRHLLQDDPIQSPKASGFLSERTSVDPIYISRMVLVETVWTLTRSYGCRLPELAGIIRALLASDDVVVEAAPSVRRAVRDAEDENGDLADAIIAHTAIDAGCDGVVTFDERAQRLPGMLPVA
jgi:predicted nucleic-acid-binding protein